MDLSERLKVSAVAVGQFISRSLQLRAEPAPSFWQSSLDKVDSYKKDRSWLRCAVSSASSQAGSFVVEKHMHGIRQSDAWP